MKKTETGSVLRITPVHKQLLYFGMKTISPSDVPDEDALVQVLVQIGEFNHTFSKRHLRDMVKNYLDKKRETSFKDDRPGRIWA
jgi:hypothetical protein